MEQTTMVAEKRDFREFVIGGEKKEGKRRDRYSFSANSLAKLKKELAERGFSVSVETDRREVGKTTIQEVDSNFLIELTSIGRNDTDYRDSGANLEHNYYYSWSEVSVKISGQRVEMLEEIVRRCVDASEFVEHADIDHFSYRSNRVTHYDNNGHILKEERWRD
jgi:hypothetical protein